MMYSRRLRIEEKKNKRKAYFFITLTLVSIVLIIFYGLPAVVKFAAFLTDLRQTQELPEQDDTIPPPPPRLDPLPESTKELSIDINGTTEPGATVVLYLNGKTQEILANNEGNFTYKFQLRKGENTISAEVKDAAGNASQKTENIKVIYDNEPPSLEITKPQDETEFFGSRQRQVVIEGKTDGGAQVQINSRLVVVESDGKFSFASTLQEGENTFTLKAQDAAGNITEKTITVSFIP